MDTNLSQSIADGLSADRPAMDTIVNFCCNSGCQMPIPLVVDQYSTILSANSHTGAGLSM